MCEIENTICGAKRQCKTLDKPTSTTKLYIKNYQYLLSASLTLFPQRNYGKYTYTNFSRGIFVFNKYTAPPIFSANPTCHFNEGTSLINREMSIIDAFNPDVSGSPAVVISCPITSACFPKARSYFSTTYAGNVPLAFRPVNIP